MSFQLCGVRGEKKGKSLAWSRRLGAAKTKADNERHIWWLTYAHVFSQYTALCIALQPLTSRRNHDRVDLIMLLTPALCEVATFAFLSSEIASFFFRLRQETTQATFQTYIVRDQMYQQQWKVKMVLQGAISHLSGGFWGYLVKVGVEQSCSPSFSPPPSSITLIVSKLLGLDGARVHTRLTCSDHT